MILLTGAILFGVGGVTTGKFKYEPQWMHNSREERVSIICFPYLSMKTYVIGIH